jgi:hypothetical protein
VSEVKKILRPLGRNFDKKVAFKKKHAISRFWKNAVFSIKYTLFLALFISTLKRGEKGLLLGGYLLPPGWLLGGPYKRPPF